MKNKRLILVLVILLVIGSLVTACGKKRSDKESEQTVVESIEHTQSTQPKSDAVADGIISEVVVEDEEDSPVSETELSKTETAPGEDTTNTTTEPTEITPTAADNDQETTSPTTSDSTQETTSPAKPNSTQETTVSTLPPNTPEETVSDYDRYMDMSADEQQAFIESFPSLEAFMAWFNNAQKEHNANEDSLIIDSGVIDLEELSKMGK